jgi:hypothetical protein
MVHMYSICVAERLTCINRGINRLLLVGTSTSAHAQLLQGL